MPPSSTSVPPRRGTRAELAEYLTDEGYPTSKSTLDKLCMPSRDEGPPVLGFWGNRAIHDFDQGLAWAREKFQRERAQRETRPRRGGDR
jgi:hypothetical protein